MAEDEFVEEVKKKQILHLNCRNFVTFPEVLRDFGNDTLEIYVRWNKLNSLPAWVGSSCLQSLTNLYLSHNCFAIFPEVLCLLRSLQVLHLDHNQLIAISASIANLQDLTELVLNKNMLCSLPCELGRLTRLRVLSVTDNQLMVIPQQIDQCLDLEQLALDRNKLQRLPQALAHLPRLQYLGLSCNQLLYLPSIPFNSQPFINLVSNPGLTWVAATLVQHHISPRSIDGWSKVNEQVCRDKSLHFPVELLTTGATSLLELCLRAVYKSLGHNCNHRSKTALASYLTLPACLQNALQQGPAFLCISCNTPVFLQGVAHLTHVCDLLTSQWPPYCVVFQCSQDCATHFEEKFTNP